MTLFVPFTITLIIITKLKAHKYNYFLVYKESLETRDFSQKTLRRTLTTMFKISSGDLYSVIHTPVLYGPSSNLHIDCLYTQHYQHQYTNTVLREYFGDT